MTNSPGRGLIDLGNPVVLLEELIELGVMTRHSGEAINLPDVYRPSFDISRKGGAPRMAVN
ncbi:hypothetical protein ABZ532_13070 [Streptomyces sp. NPDC019396]|uniref:hypothetical protein n=1 Tax=Streptomyces sp. NPDC019396 TaxID=3154687 RepID=UPI0033C66506